MVSTKRVCWWLKSGYEKKLMRTLSSIKGFSFALMIGVVVGTYSSLCIASPSVVDLTKSIMPVNTENK